MSFSTHSRVLLFVTAIIVQVFGQVCLAADAAADDSDKQTAVEENQLVITANRVPSDKLSLANNAERLEQETLERIAAVHINEALARSAGVWISRGNGQEHLTAIRSPVFTGPGSCGEFLMVEDGVPLRATGFCNVNQLFDVNFEQASAIEVVKGANSSLYGSNAIHGTLQIFTPDPMNQVSSLAMDLGPNEYRRIRARWATAEDQQGTLLQASGTTDGGYKDDSGFDQQKLNFVHSYGSDNWTVDTRFSAANLNQETAGFLQAGLNAYRDPDLRRRNDFPEAFRDAQSFRFQSRIATTTDTQNARSEWFVRPYLRSNEMQFLMHFLPGQPVETNGHDSIGVQAGYRWLDSSSEWQIGLDTERTEGFLRQFQASPTQTGSAFLNAVLAEGPQYDYRVDAQAIGAYLRSKQWLTADWFLQASVRFDQLDYQYDNRLTDGNLRPDGTPCGFGGCRYTRPADRNDSFSDPSWSLATGYQWNASSNLYAKLDRAYRAPQATELYRLQNGQSSADLDGVVADAIEFGVRVLKSGWQLELALFSIEKDDVIFQNNDREFVSGAETSHRGIEFTSGVQLSEQFSLRLAATYARHRYENSADLRGVNAVDIRGNDIDTAPRFIGNLTALWAPDEFTQLELEWLALDDYFTNPENTQRYAGHQLVNLRGQYQWNRQLTLSLRATNLLDERYAERADFAFGNDRYFVGEPTNVFVGIEWRFN